MALQLFTFHKSLAQSLHDLALLLRQFKRMSGIYGGEIHVQHLIFPGSSGFLIFHPQNPFLIVDPVQEHPVLHAELRMPPDQLSFQFKLYHGHGLVHFCIQSGIFCIIICAVPYGKNAAVRIPVDIHGKGCQRQQIDTIPVLQRVQIAIARRNPHHVGNARHMSAGSPHPGNIMVSPLYIHGMIGTQSIHDDMGPRPPVIDIPHNMQMIYHKTLDQFAQGNNKLWGPADPDNRVYNFIIIGFLVMNLRFFRDQFFNHIGEIFRQGFAHLGTGIF